MIRVFRSVTCAVGMLFATACFAMTSHAQAALTIGRFDSSLTTTPSQGATPVPSTAAGGHPDLNIDLRFPPDGQYAGEDPREVTVQLPPGLVGDPTAVPTCSQKQFTQIVSRPDFCGPSSQVGIAAVAAASARTNQPDDVQDFGYAPVYNLERRTSNEVARLGFIVPSVGIRIYLEIQPRTDGDYGLEAKAGGFPRFVQLTRTRLSIWGVPTDSVHDPQRFEPEYGEAGINGDNQGEVLPNPGGARTGFLSAPTRCGSPLTTSISGTSYETPDVPASRAGVLSSGLDGCDLIPFAPSLLVQNSDSSADTPTGVTARVTVPQQPTGADRVSAHLRRAEVTLPEGMSLNGPVANGLRACEDSDLKLGTREAATCPDASKVGSALIDVPILGGSLTGKLVVRPQTPDDTYRVAIVASGFGVNVKLPGSVLPDPSSGRVRAVFDETPQVPFRSIELAVDGGPRAAFANAPDCQTSAASGIFTPWSGTSPVVAQSAPSTTVWGDGESCPAAIPFAPSLTGGAESPTSGRTSAFSIRLRRDDRNQQLRGVSVNAPEGLTAIVKGVPLCDLDKAAAGSCPASSRIGSVAVGAGAGTSPIYVRGTAYLTRGYKGAPYGMSFVVPVIAGPFNLGTVVVQAQVKVDPTTARLAVTTDPFPSIVKGVPLRIRDVQVNVDRPRFTLVPTNCKPKTLDGSVESLQGAFVRTSAPFQASGCSRQSFKPKFALGLRGKGVTTDGKHPALAAIVRQQRGAANLSKVRATLPSTLALDPDNAQALCEYEAGKRADCPRSSIVGRAKITTPLLNKPLRGPVYFVKNVRRNSAGRLVRTLPTLLITLRGEIALNLRAITSVAGGKNLVTTFAGIPDQPFSRFDLFINGGKNGILVANSNVCRGSRAVLVESNAQSGKTYDPRVRLGAPCSSKP